MGAFSVFPYFLYKLPWIAQNETNTIAPRENALAARNKILSPPTTSRLGA
jgi:hypothetical protein